MVLLTPMAEVEVAMEGLLSRGLAGDAPAYRAFLEAATCRIRAFIRVRMRHAPDNVEDLVQETLIAMHNQRHTWDASAPVGPWMLAIARHKLIDNFRRHGRRAPLEEPIDDAVMPTTPDEAEISDSRRDIYALLATLPDHHRLPVVYVKLEGLSVSETAQRTGMSESAIKVGIHRGLKALARRFGETP